MKSSCGEDGSETSSVGVFELSGEPAVVITGLPPLSTNEGSFVHSTITGDAESQKSRGFGEWLEGREVQKMFGEHFYNGIVSEFDKETGWYRVLYEDGDFEDLEWHELEALLLPLDVTVPLKTLALKVIRKKHKPTQKFGRAKSRDHQAQPVHGKGNTSGGA